MRSQQQLIIYANIQSPSGFRNTGTYLLRHFPLNAVISRPLLVAIGWIFKELWERFMISCSYVYPAVYEAFNDDEDPTSH